MSAMNKAGGMPLSETSPMTMPIYDGQVDEVVKVTADRAGGDDERAKIVAGAFGHLAAAKCSAGSGGRSASRLRAA